MIEMKQAPDRLEDFSDHDLEPSESKGKCQPWLNEDGSTKTDDEVRAISKDWDQETWDEFLKVPEPDLEEILLLDPRQIEKFTEDFTCMIARAARQEKYSHLRQAAREALKKLTAREYEIFEMSVIDHKSSRRVAHELNISRFTVRRTLYRVYGKVRKIILEDSINTRLRHLRIVNPDPSLPT